MHRITPSCPPASENGFSMVELMIALVVSVVIMSGAASVMTGAQRTYQHQLDDVTVEQEVELKRRAERSGLLVMGPGCGTAMLGGTGLGFANVVQPGPVGIVAAAGTGAQEAACLVDAAGVGISEIVGVGGRDLSAEVGGAMFRAGMRLLAGDDATETLLLVAKAPAPQHGSRIGLGSAMAAWARPSIRPRVRSRGVG